ncbi:hypothetical protein BASA81_001944 [Batrachochytrium salamandrivorans]|nr:hypothetical protein BASA81_001944 [Batrachochytrium salamandrivorans]
MKRNLSSQPATKQHQQQKKQAYSSSEEEERLPQRNPSSDEDEDDDDDEDDDEEEDNLQDDFGGSDDDEDEDDMEEGGEETLNVVGSSKFTSALKKLLVVGGDGQQQEEEIITSKQDLFLKKTKIQRLTEQEMREAKDKRRKLQARSEFDLRNLDTLQGVVDPTKINKERELKRTATRGVVALFNAIGSHQRVITTTANPTVQAQSKENFLKMLKEKALGKATATSQQPNQDEEDEEDEEERVAKPSSWKVLQDDYLEQVAEDDSGEEAEQDMTIREHE